MKEREREAILQLGTLAHVAKELGRLGVGPHDPVPRQIDAIVLKAESARTLAIVLQAHSSRSSSLGFVP